MTAGPPAPGEEGYALVAAVASILVFSAMALAVIAAGRSSTIATGAEIDRVKLSAAADAGFALAVASLVDPGPAGPPRIGGQARHMRFGEADLSIAIENEAGKVPLNGIDRAQARRLFALLGVSGERLDIVTDSFLDWIDEDEDPRTNGAENDYYTERHIRPRNGNLRSVAETGLIRGFDPRLVAALTPVATVHFGRGSFRPDQASLIAIEALEGEDEGAVDLINRRRELEGQSVALDTTDAKGLAGTALTIDVAVRLDDGARRRDRSLVVLTGKARPSYVVIERN